MRTMTKADEAVSHMLRRIAEDADVSHLLFDTHAFTLLCEAQAERVGVDVAAVRRRVEAAKPRYPRRYFDTATVERALSRVGGSRHEVATVEQIQKMLAAEHAGDDDEDETDG